MDSRLAVDLVAAVVGVLAVGALGLLFVAVRRFLLERGPGTVECGLRVVDPVADRPPGAASTPPGPPAPPGSAASSSPPVPPGPPAAPAGGPGPVGRAWRLGLARYRADELHWYRIFDISLRPRAVLCRRGLAVSSRRVPSAREAAALGGDAAIVLCRTPGADPPVELAMSDAALTGFLAWLEAAPPGFHLGRSA